MHEEYYKNVPSTIKFLFRGRLEPEREEGGRRQSYLVVTLILDHL